MYVGDVTLLPIVQRRAQLVAHGRQKLILEPAAALNFFFSKKDGTRKLFNLSFGSFKLRGALSDALLQLITSHSQSSLALLDLRQHLVEGIDKDSQLGRAADRRCAD